MVNKEKPVVGQKKITVAGDTARPPDKPQLAMVGMLQPDAGAVVLPTPELPITPHAQQPSEASMEAATVAPATDQPASPPKPFAVLAQQMLMRLGSLPQMATNLWQPAAASPAPRAADVPLALQTPTSAADMALGGADQTSIQVAEIPIIAVAAPSLPTSVAATANPPSPILGVAAGVVANATIPTAAAVSAQVVPAIMVGLHDQGGTKTITIQLHPQTLGRVQVIIDQPPLLPAKISVGVESSHTLALLRDDWAGLSRALDQAGVPAPGRQITLHIESAPSAASPPRVEAVPSSHSNALDTGSGQQQGALGRQGTPWSGAARGRMAGDDLLAAQIDTDAPMVTQMLGLNITA
jgi:hypothetical protein